MAANIKIVALLAARPGHAEALRALLFGMAPHSRAEAGNLRWDIWQDQSEPGRFVLDELYKDDAAVAAHRETPHFKNYLSKINDLAERTAAVLDPADVA
ncbi:MAG TPA: putative quinol monooxygenase [Aliidongia sp.]|nr:putative quinol monooxygenase [Aliidongia sp.]